MPQGSWTRGDVLYCELIPSRSEGLKQTFDLLLLHRTRRWRVALSLRVPLTSAVLGFFY